MSDIDSLVVSAHGPEGSLVQFTYQSFLGRAKIWNAAIGITPIFRQSANGPQTKIQFMLESCSLE